MLGLVKKWARDLRHQRQRRISIWLVASRSVAEVDQTTPHPSSTRALSLGLPRPRIRFSKALIKRRGESLKNWRQCQKKMFKPWERGRMSLTAKMQLVEVWWLYDLSCPGHEMQVPKTRYASTEGHCLLQLGGLGALKAQPRALGVQLRALEVQWAESSKNPVFYIT